MAAVSAMRQQWDECGRSEMEIKDTYYWPIRHERGYYPYAEPKGHTLGDLNETHHDLQEH